MSARGRARGTGDHTQAHRSASARPVVVAVAGDAIAAAIWVDALRAAGIEAVSFERGVGAAFGGAESVASTHPVLVPASSLVPARNVIAELAGGGALAPVRDDTNEPPRRQEALTAAVLAAFAMALVVLALRAVGFI